MSKIATDNNMITLNLKSVSSFSIAICALIAYYVSTVAIRIEDEKEAQQTITISLAAICYAWAESITLKDYVGTTLEAVIIITLFCQLFTLPTSKEEIRRRIFLIHTAITLSTMTFLVGQSILCVVRKINSEYYIVGQGASFFMISIFIIIVFDNHLTLSTPYITNRKQYVLAITLIAFYSLFGTAVIHPKGLPSVNILNISILHPPKIAVLSIIYSATLCLIFGITTQHILNTNGNSLIKMISNRKQIIQRYFWSGAIAGFICGSSTYCIKFFTSSKPIYPTGTGHIFIETGSYMIYGIILGHFISSIAPNYQKIRSTLSLDT